MAKRIVERVEIPDYCAEVYARTGGNADADMCEMCPGPCRVPAMGAIEGASMEEFVMLGMGRDR